MTATRQDIERWLKDAPQGTSHMIVAVDRFDYENYPIYIPEGQNPKDQKLGDMTGFDECYCLREDFELSIEQQLNERRANHWD